MRLARDPVGRRGLTSPERRAGKLAGREDLSSRGPIARRRRRREATVLRRRHVAYSGREIEYNRGATRVERVYEKPGKGAREAFSDSL
jgi:hypothetical protein